LPKRIQRILQYPYLPIILGPVLLFSPVFLTGKALFWGTPSTQFIPWWDFAWETLLGGHLPLWNPWVGMGAPLAANYQSALFYPPYWLHLLVYAMGGVSWMAWSITLLVVFHLCWGGIGIARLLEEIGVDKLGQTISGLAFALSGYMVARAGFLSINATSAWLPWVLLYSKQLVDKKPKAILKTGLAIGMMMLAGHAQTAWYVILLGGTWIVYWGLQTAENSNPFRNGLAAAGKYMTAGLLGFGISAVQLIPTFEYLLQSRRSVEYGFAEAMTYSFWPWRFFGLFVPNLFGSPASGNYWGYGNYWEDAIYIGMLPIILALGVILGLVKKTQNKDHNQSLVKLLIVITGVGFIFALGKNTPVFPFLYRYIPSFDLFQAPARFSIWAEFSLVVLAGIGADRLKPPAGKKLYWNRLSVAGCAAISISAGAAWYFLQDIKTTFITSIGLAGLWGLCSALLLLFQPKKGTQAGLTFWRYGLILFVGIDLMIAGWGLNPAIDRSFYVVDRSSKTDNRYIMPLDDEYAIKIEKFFRFDTFDPDLEWKLLYDYLLPNMAMLRRIEIVNNFDPITPSRYQNWMEYLERLDFTDSDVWANDQSVNLMALGGLSLLQPDGTVMVNILKKDPIDRVKLLSCPRYFQDEDQILSLVYSGEVDLSKEVILIGTQDSQAEFCADQTGGDYRILEERPGYLKLSADLPGGGWVFWSQSWYPGWVIKIDENNIGSSLKSNYLFQAAEIPPGAHQVEFSYSPFSFKLGAALTAVALLIAGWGLISGKKTDLKRSFL
jgi:hypothetical protein